MINSFFVSMSERFRKENDLSDILYALLKADENFRSQFLEIIDLDNDDPLEIFREYQNDAGDRPDIYVEGPTSSSLLEIKLWDRNYHFDQYALGFPDSKRRFISIYKLNDNDAHEAKKYGFNCYTWSDIVTVFKKQSNQNTDLVNSALKYIEEVCAVETLRKATDLDSIKNLNSILRLFRVAISETLSIDGTSVSLYPTPRRAYDESWSGCYMQVERGEKKVWPCIALVFDDSQEHAEITIWFEYDWNKELSTKAAKISAPTGTDKRISNSDGYFEFKMQRDNYNKLINASVDEQKSIIKTFIEDVIRAVAKYI